MIDDWLSAFDHVERHDIVVGADRACTYSAVRGVDLARDRIIGLLFAFRGLPLLVRGGRDRRRSLTLDSLLGGGFVLLAEEPGVELVLGVVGRFWRPTGGIRRIDADEFVGFAEPGYAKAAWNLRVESLTPDTSHVTTETRVALTDDASRRAFRRYWRVVGPFSGLIRRRILALVKQDAERET